MSATSATSFSPLRTCEGELLQLSIEVDLRHIEPLLDRLAGLPFPVNPAIVHPHAATSAVRVEFPAYGRRLESVFGILAAAGLSGDSLHVRRV